MSSKSAGCIACVCAAVSGFSPAALAASVSDLPALEPETFEQEPSNVIRVASTANAVLGLSDRCSRDADVISCSGGSGFLAFDLSGFYRISPGLSVGPRALFGIEAGHRGTASSDGTSTREKAQLFSFGIDGRYRPYAAGLWLGPRLGALVLRNITETTEAGPTAGTTSTSQWTWAAFLGAAVGYDLAISQFFAFEFKLCADYAVTGHGDAFPKDGETEYSSGPWLFAGIGVMLSP